MAIKATPGPTFEYNGSFSAPCKFVVADPDALDVGPKMYEIEFIPLSGADGQGSTDHGYRNRNIKFKVCYVAGSRADVLAAYLADVDSMVPGPVSLDIDGSPFFGVWLDPSTKLGMIRPTMNGSGMFYAYGEFVLNAKQLTAG